MWWRTCGPSVLRISFFIGRSRIARVGSRLPAYSATQLCLNLFYGSFRHLDGLLLVFFLSLSPLSQKPNHGPTTPLTRPRSSARARRRPAPQSFFPPTSTLLKPPHFSIDRSINNHQPTSSSSVFQQRRRPWRSFPVKFPLGKPRPAYNKRT